VVRRVLELCLTYTDIVRLVFFLVQGPLDASTTYDDYRGELLLFLPSRFRG
jgi:hypothetical protein